MTCKATHAISTAEITQSRDLDLQLIDALEVMLSVAEPFEFAWTNRLLIERRASNVLVLVDLLLQVGKTEEWAWIETWLVDRPNVIAQACGRSDRGFVVEIGNRINTDRVVRPGVPWAPKRNIATRNWAYYCAEAELIDLGTAATLMSDWITHRSVDGNWEFRPPYPRASA